jgi:hypothetical protein
MPVARAAPKDATLAWRTCKAREGVHAGLVDTRSLIVAHDHRVTLGTPFAVGDLSITFDRVEGDRVTWSASPAGKGVLTRTPALLKVRVRERKYALSVRVDSGQDAVWVSSAWGVRFDVGREVAYLVDSDLDGRVPTPGDGYVAPESRTVGPWRAQAWTRADGVLLRRAEDGNWECATAPVPYPEHEDHTAAWRLLQWRRQQCGVLPVAYKAALEPGIRLHGEYCVANGYRGHHQDPTKKAYSPQGARSGAESVLGYGIETFVEGVEQQLATLYHRSGLLQPGLTHTGMALHRRVFGANVRDSVDGPLRANVVVVPPHGMESAPREFNPGGETPMPVANRLVGVARLGTSVGAYAGPMEHAQHLAERPSLRVTRLIGSKRKPGPSFRLDLYYPGKTPNPGVPRSNFGNVALTPPRPLEARTTYLCRIRIALPGGAKTALDEAGPFEYEWEFTTGP